MFPGRCYERSCMPAFCLHLNQTSFTRPIPILCESKQRFLRTVNEHCWQSSCITIPKVFPIQSSQRASAFDSDKLGWISFSRCIGLTCCRKYISLINPDIHFHQQSMATVFQDFLLQRIKLRLGNITHMWNFTVCN